MNFEIETQTQFEKLLECEFPTLEPINKWNQTMWHKEGHLIISLIFLSKKFKICFFNNPNITLHKLQRWSSTIYSQNLEYKNDDKVDWDKIQELLNNTIQIIAE